MELVTSLLGLTAITLLTPVLLIIARHRIASPPGSMNLISLAGLVALSAYFYRQDLWLMMMIVISNVVWVNLAQVGSVIGQRGNYRITHLLNIAVFVFMLAGWGFMSEVMKSHATPLAELLILTTGAVLALIILLSVLPWVPDSIKRPLVILPLITGCQFLLAVACYQEQAWIGVAFYVITIMISWSYRQQPKPIS